MENAAGTLAGGIELGESQLTNTRIVSNRAEYGGGVWIDAMGASLVENCTIADNVATEAGGGLMCYGRFPSIIRSSTFVRNSAPVGSGLGFSAIIHSAENTLESSIVTLGDGPAIVCYGTSSVTVSCTDIFGNRDGNWVGCIASFAGIDGNLEADPRFCNPKADWSLCAESPCAPGQSGACGQIGAFGTGCSCPISVEPTTWGKIKANYE